MADTAITDLTSSFSNSTGLLGIFVELTFFLVRVEISQEDSPV